MVRLADLPEWEREHMLAKIADLPSFADGHWTESPPLAQCRVAIVTTAGLHRKDDRPFGPSAVATDYRVIPGDTPATELTMSHQSVNFDRTGFQEDLNVVFPLERLHELAADRVIGSVADFHYALMGAAAIQKLQPSAQRIAELLLRDRVDAVLLTPV